MILIWGPKSGEGHLRPRPGRLEFCGEYIDGDRLAHAALFVAASVTALAAVLDGETTPPSLLATTTRPLPNGLASKCDGAVLATTYQGGRAAIVNLAGGGHVSVADYLQTSWDFIAPFASAVALPQEILGLRASLAGNAPLGVEEALHQVTREIPSREPVFAHAVPRKRAGSGQARLDHRYGRHWRHSLYSVQQDGTAAVVPVRREQLGDFAEFVESGGLDAVPMIVNGMLAKPGDLDKPALYSGLATPRLLLPVEREPGVIRLQNTSGASSSGLPVVARSAVDRPRSPMSVQPQERADRPGKWLFLPPVTSVSDGEPIPVSFVGEPPLHSTSAAALVAAAHARGHRHVITIATLISLMFLTGIPPFGKSTTGTDTPAGQRPDPTGDGDGHRDRMTTVARSLRMMVKTRRMVGSRHPTMLGAQVISNSHQVMGASSRALPIRPRPRVRCRLPIPQLRKSLCHQLKLPSRLRHSRPASPWSLVSTQAHSRQSAIAMRA